ncbi:MAG TPA: hypothetical protein VFE51_31225 [Verrucomicrobiae bacterium]|nr:hypothetical protein [Verrucomicrobiae bacterium]
MRELLFCSLVCVLGVKPSFADTSDPSTAVSSSLETRYGFLNLLDHRSDYGQGIYPEPFLVDDSDLEPNEARVDWLHTEADGFHSDSGKVEIEKGFGLMTLELEVPYERDRSEGITTSGFNNIDLGARYPFFQWVSPNGLVDSTAGAAIEVGIPTQSVFSKNAELVPKLFNDLKIGRFTAQSIFGYSRLFGPGEEGGVQTFEYGFVFGYTITRRQLPLPGVLEAVPFFELSGETTLNKNNAGQNSLLGNVGVRFNMKSIGRVQPRPGVGFVFPLDSGARQDTHWGIIASLVFQF